MVHMARLGSDFFPKNEKLEKVVHGFLLNLVPLAILHRKVRILT